MRYADRLAFAEGYHAGYTGVAFDQLYEEFDLKVQFNFGYRAGQAKLQDELENNLQRLEESNYAKATEY